MPDDGDDNGSRRNSSGAIEWGAQITQEPAAPAATITFHIKNMGHDTWSGQLAELALALADAPAGAAATSLAISVDGAYGRAGRYADRRHVVLVTGGIGFTPAHAIAMDLVARLRDPDGQHGDPGRVRRVTIVWVSRDESLFTVFANSLASILAEEDAAAAGRVSKPPAIDVRLHCTHPDANAAGPGAATTLARAHSLRAKFSSRTLVHDLAAAPRYSRSGVRNSMKSGALLRNGAPAGEFNDDDNGDEDDFDEPLLPAGSDAAAVDAANAADNAFAAGLRTSPWDVGMCEEAAASAVLAHIRSGRPDLRTLLLNIAQDAEAESAAESLEGRAEPLSELVSVFVCGPDAMIEESSALAEEYGLDFHSEVFNF